MSDRKTVYLSDYQPFTHLVRQVRLTFRLAPKATRVIARIDLAPNPARPGGHDLRLDGEGLRLIAAGQHDALFLPARKARTAFGNDRL